MTYVIEAGVSFDDDFLSGHLAAVLSFLGLCCTFQFVLSVVNTEASCVGRGFICAHTGTFIRTRWRYKDSRPKKKKLCFVLQCDLAEPNIKGGGRQTEFTWALSPSSSAHPSVGQCLGYKWSSALVCGHKKCCLGCRVSFLQPDCLFDSPGLKHFGRDASSISMV